MITNDAISTSGRMLHIITLSKRRQRIEDIQCIWFSFSSFPILNNMNWPTKYFQTTPRNDWTKYPLSLTPTVVIYSWWATTMIIVANKSYTAQIIQRFNRENLAHTMCLLYGLNSWTMTDIIRKPGSLLEMYSVTILAPTCHQQKSISTIR